MITASVFPFCPEIGSYIDPKTAAHVVADSPDIGDSPVAVKRFWQVLTRARWGTHQFGRDPPRELAADAPGPKLRRAAIARCWRSLLCSAASNQVRERLFLKRIHPDVSWALNKSELKSPLSTDGKPYWRRARQLEAFFSAPRGKPIMMLDKSICTMMVAAHCVRTACGALAGNKARNVAQGLIWRVA